MTDYAIEVHKLLINKRKTLSIAESCTGGMISHLLTNNSGASDYLLIDVVAYSVLAKNRILKIDMPLIERYGTVSPEIATAMARSVKGLTGSDYALATTGNLGPHAIEDKKLGLFFIALCSQKDAQVRDYVLSGDRMSNKIEASHLALKMLYDELLNVA